MTDVMPNYATQAQDVSCRLILSWFPELEKRDLPFTLLETWTGYPLAHLQDKNNRISWVSYCQLLAEARAILDDEGFIAKGGAFNDTPLARPFLAIARLLFSGKDLYFWMAGPRGPSSFMYSCLTNSMYEVAPNVLELEIGTQFGYAPPPREFLLVTKGSLTALPRVVGLGEAKVTLTFKEETGLFRIEVPQGGGTLAWLRRLVTRPFNARAAAHELQAAHELLRQQYKEMEHEVLQRRQAETLLQEQQVVLEQTNRDLEKFAYIVSHDLKAPLRGIRNLTTWLGESLADSLTEESEEYLTLLETRVARMEALIAGILDYSRSSRAATQTDEVAVATLLHEIVTGLVVPSSFTIYIGPDMPTLVTDVVRLEQMFTNLISNAIKYNDKEQGQVQITVTEAAGFYWFACHDNGKGIEAAHHESIFDIFQTLQGAEAVGGTGVGLAIVKKIAQDVGGEIKVASVVGEGTTFTFSWPKVLVMKG